MKTKLKVLHNIIERIWTIRTKYNFEQFWTIWTILDWTIGTMWTKLEMWTKLDIIKRVLPEASFLEECHPDILPDNLPDFLSRKFAQNYVPSLYIVLNLPETRFHCSREAKITNF